MLNVSGRDAFLHSKYLVILVKLPATVANLPDTATETREKALFGLIGSANSVHHGGAATFLAVWVCGRDCSQHKSLGSGGGQRQEAGGRRKVVTAKAHLYPQ